MNEILANLMLARQPGYMVLIDEDGVSVYDNFHSSSQKLKPILVTTHVELTQAFLSGFEINWDWRRVNVD